GRVRDRDVDADLVEALVQQLRQHRGGTIERVARGYTPPRDAHECELAALGGRKHLREAAAVHDEIEPIGERGTANLREDVVRVRGDDEHPVSRGYTCSKGRGLAGWHHASNRLDRPRVRGHECTWDELLADLGSRLDAIIDASGPDAVALYLATGMAYDAAG